MWGREVIFVEQLVDNGLERDRGSLPDKEQMLRLRYAQAAIAQEQLARALSIQNVLGERIAIGDISAVSQFNTTAKTILAASERVSKLLGLDAPTKIEGTGDNGAILLEAGNSLIEKLARLASEGDREAEPSGETDAQSPMGVVGET
jgi:hypothetical protein